MNNKRATKRAQLTSIMALVMCVVMLVGTTFAWFTDTASTGVNKIQAGNLDVKLSYLTKEGWQEVTDTTELFDDEAFWEPGHTEVAYLMVENVGNLALKYQLSVNVANEVTGTSVLNNTIKLSDYIKMGVVDNQSTAFADRNAARAAVQDAGNIATYTKNGKIAANGAAQCVAMVVYMPETVGNEANYVGNTAPSIELGVKLFATQDTVEKDSFDDQYDKDAPANVTTAADANAIADAIAAAKNDGVPAKIVLSGDVSNVDLNGGDVTVDVADKKLTIKNDAANNAPTISDGSVTITGTDGSKLGNNKIVVDSAVLTIGVGLAYSNSYQAVPFEVRNGGTLNITKGDNSSNGSQSMLVKASGEGTVANISGGKFTSSAAGVTFVAANDGAVVNVSGGTFSGSGVGNYVFYANGGTIVISNCTVPSFNRNNNAEMFKVENGGKIVVTGGTFKADPSAYVDTAAYDVTRVGSYWTVTAK